MSDISKADGGIAPAQPVMNRWLVVVGAVLIQLCLGAIYAWSVFTPALVKEPFGFTKAQTQWIFGVGLLCFALSMIFAGKWQVKAGPTLVARTGGVVLGLGYVLAKFAGTSFPGLLVTIGVLGGIGIGLAYVIPIAVGVKWFPDKKGLITGLAVAGFGFGALIWIKVAGAWGGLIASHGVSNVFMYYGVAFFVLVMIGSLWMKNPPADWRPEGWSPQAAAASGASSGLTTMQMLGTPQFYMLWLMFLCGAMAGLMVIGVIKLFGIEALQARAGLDEAAASAAAGTAMAVFFSIANGLGRILWGAMSDSLGRKLSLTLMMATQGVMMLVFVSVGGSAWGLYIASAIVGFNFGGNFALFPAATADTFGNKTVGANYPWVFMAYGIGGIVGPQIGAYFGERADWNTAFIVGGIACLVAAALGLMLRPPKLIAETTPGAASPA